MEKTEVPNSYNVPALGRGIRLLEILAEAEQPMSLTDLANALDIGRSSAFRLVHTLRNLDYLKEIEQSGTYTVGTRVLSLGFTYLSRQPVTAVAQSHLEALRDLTGQSAHLSVLEGHEVVYLGSYQARSVFVSNLMTGTRVPVNMSVIGWCLLMDFSKAQITEYCQGFDMKPATVHTPVNAEALYQRVEQVRQDGFVISRGFRQPGGTSIAVPLRNHLARIVGCISLSGPDAGFDLERLNSFYLPQTQQAATQISKELGYEE